MWSTIFCYCLVFIVPLSSALLLLPALSGRTTTCKTASLFKLKLRSVILCIFVFLEECKPGQFNCTTTGECLDAKLRCDHVNDCPDGADEKGCGNIIFVFKNNHKQFYIF